MLDSIRAFIYALWLSFKENKRAALGISAAVVIVIALFVVAILGPVAISTIANADTTNWDPSVVTVFQVLLPILAVIGLAIKFLPRK